MNEKLNKLKILINNLEDLLTLEERYKNLSKKLDQASITIKIGHGLDSTFIEQININESDLAQTLIEKRLVQIGLEITETEANIKSL